MPNPAEAAAKKLAWEMGSWKSIEFRLGEDFVNKDPGRKPSEPRTFHASYHYIETAAGQRLFENRLVSDLNPRSLVSIDYTDGSKCAFLYRIDQGETAGQDQVTIKRWFGRENEGVAHRPEPLRYLYHGLKPLYEVLTAGEYAGEGREIGRECDRFLFKPTPGGKDPAIQVYSLDRETGITLRFEHFANQEEWSAAHPYYVWIAKSLDVVDGHHLVRTSELLTYQPTGPNPQRPTLEYKVHAEEVAFDRDYPSTTFWPAISKQTKLIDTIANKIVIPSTPSEKTASTTAPIRASDPAGWSLTYSSATIIIGAAALCIGLLLHRRR
jgi:hypothetical protein